MSSILVVEDETGQRKVLQRILEREGYEVTLAENGLIALDKIEDTMFDLVISDMRMPGMTGRDLLREVKQRDPDLPVLIVTAFAELKDAVDLVAREGAFYYLEKPINNDVLKAQIKRALEARGVLTDGEPKQVSQPVPEIHFERIIGQSERMNQLFKTMSRIIHRGVNQVLITGETGTGKDLVARAIHEKGYRKDQPFVAVNCSSVPHELIESELFGHEKGSFTGADRQKKGLFEVASGGVIFLDEIGDISMAAQSKFLRVLQDPRDYESGGDRTNKS